MTSRLTKLIATAPNLEVPIFVMAVTPGRDGRRTGGTTRRTRRIERLFGRRFGDMKEARIAEDLVRFTVESTKGDLLRVVSVI